MNLSSEKSKLRKIFKQKRLELSTAELEERSNQISKNFIQNLLPKIYSKKSDKVFSLYLASNNEASTAGLAEHFKKNQIKFSYPKIIAKNQPLEFIATDNEQAFVENIFFPTIFEPAFGEKILPDFVILPLLAFDNSLSRLGMGGGFFDRTIEVLKKQKPEILTIGLAFDIQRLETTLPIEKTDQRLDFIVTEKIIFSAS
jgi:5-formyltetrahydrofolate cyclo-ligase